MLSGKARNVATAGSDNSFVAAAITGASELLPVYFTYSAMKSVASMVGTCFTTELQVSVLIAVYLIK